MSSRHAHRRPPIWHFTTLEVVAAWVLEFSEYMYFQQMIENRDNIGYTFCKVRLRIRQLQLCLRFPQRGMLHALII